MPWFKVDDSFESHPKVKSIPPARRAKVIGLWTLAGSWAARHMTDGFVPDYMLTELASTKKEARSLVDVGLWLERSGGYQFKDWCDWQPTRAKVEAERDAARQRMAAARERKKGVSSGNVPANASEPVRKSSGDVRLTPTRPDPTRPKEEKHSVAAGAAQSDPPGFDEFWTLYPRKVARPRALAAYRSALKRTSCDAILSGLRAQMPAFDERDARYIPHPTTWLNGDRWADPMPRLAVSRVQGHMALAAQLAGGSVTAIGGQS